MSEEKCPYTFSEWHKRNLVTLASFEKEKKCGKDQLTN